MLVFIMFRLVLRLFYVHYLLLLRLLALHENDLMPRELALTKIWRDDNYFTSRSMDVYIAKLRKYLKRDDSVEILNIHGEGFRLVVKNEEEKK